MRFIIGFYVIFYLVLFGLFIASCTTVNIRCYNELKEEVSCNIDRERYSKY